MYEPLHHKYRPQTFSQLVGQGAIAATLTHALQQNRIAPAYLFCGPRGTGKTSSARILAKSLNCLTVDAPTAEPCGQCDVCQSVTRGNALDIVEIDAASNTGVDNIRELIERAQFAPVQCRYKLFVLDEVHMLSTAAFNALLKTLEEPPEQVVFVLATTDPQRVLPTIISRCQRFDFRRIPLPSMVKHLGYIATEEDININGSAIQLVAQISQGGLRDAESLLDQLSLQTDEITVETVWDLVGAVPERDLLNLVRAIAADDGTALLERVRHLMDKGREPLIVLQSLVGFYRDLLIAKRAPNREDLVAITPPTWAEMAEFAQRLSASQLLASQQKLQSAEVQIKNTTQPRLWLEITLTGLLPSALGALSELSSTATAVSPAIKPPAIKPPAIKPPVMPTSAKAPPPTATAPTTPAPTSPAPSQPAPNQPSPESSQPPPHSPNANPAGPPSNTAPKEAPNEAPHEDHQEETKQAPAEAPDEAFEPSAPEVSFGSLSDLWNQLLTVLEPRGTQMLMSQQGSLLGFDGVIAKVGFRSASLQKMARERIPNLEAAFEAIFQRKIQVSLEVVTPPKEAAAETDTPPTGSARPAPPKQPKLPPNSSTQGNQTNGTKPHREPPSAQSQTPNPTESPSGSHNLHPSVENGNSPQEKPRNTSRDSAQGNSRLDAPTGHIEMDQDQEKIKRFANFFNGQIVSLDDEVDPTPPDGASPSQKSPDPGPDVPF
ncbi:MAG: DNA polymerase III subunit gamma/tau [Cyanobacteria bacterium J06554_11]